MNNKRAACKIFDNFCDDVKCFLRKGDVAWIVSLRRGASMYIHGQEYVIQGMTNRTMKLKDSLEAEQLPIYEIMRNKKISDVVFLSELKVWFENKIVEWSWSPEASDDEEEEDDHPPIRTSSSTTRKRTRMYVPTSSSEEEEDDDREEGDGQDDDEEESIDVAEYEDALSDDDQRRKYRDKEDREWIMGQMRVEQLHRQTPMRTEPRIGDLYCVKCGGYYNYSDFSRAQMKAKTEERYCLRHSTTSDFNRPAIVKVNVTDEGEGEVY